MVVPNFSLVEHQYVVLVVEVGDRLGSGRFEYFCSSSQSYFAVLSSPITMVLILARTLPVRLSTMFYFAIEFFSFQFLFVDSEVFSDLRDKPDFHHHDEGTHKHIVSTVCS